MGLLSIMTSPAVKAAKKTVKKKLSSRPQKGGSAATIAQLEFPIPGYQFAVMMKDEKAIAFFQNVTGLSVKRKVEPVIEGGENSFTREFPGPLTYGHVTLEVGLTSSKMFLDWMMQGKYTAAVEKRGFFLVQFQPKEGGTPTYEEVKRWSFENAYPVSWKLSNLSADSTQKIAIESLELTFDFFELQD